MKKQAMAKQNLNSIYGEKPPTVASFTILIASLPALISGPSVGAVEAPLHALCAQIDNLIGSLMEWLTGTHTRVTVIKVQPMSLGYLINRAFIHALRPNFIPVDW
jgi:hypothetical protein